jgi:hypothetical protein
MRFTAALAAVGLLAGLATISSAPAAHAAADQTYGIVGPPICDSGASYCMNNWSGSGVVNMYQWESDLYNEKFQIELQTDRCNGGETPTCPFANHSIDAQVYDEGGGSVVSIEDLSTGLCLATAEDGDAIEGTCPTDGEGGAPGNIFVYTSNGVLYSNYWTNSNDQLTCVTASDVNDTPVDLNSEAGLECNEWSPT